MSVTMPASDGVEPEGSDDEEQERTRVDYGFRFECSCGNLSQLSYRCDDPTCATDLAGEGAKTTRMWAGEEVGDE